MSEKEKLVDQVVADIWEDRYNMESFILEVVHAHVSTWNLDDLKDYLGIDPDAEVKN